MRSAVRPGPAGRRPPDIHIELNATDHAEPARERGRHIDPRTRAILTTAIVTALAVNAGTVWAYWKVGASAPAAARSGVPVELTLRGRSDLNRPLQPGGTGNLTVTLTNDNDFPIRITSVSPAAGNAVADAEHRDLGCLSRTGVSVTRRAFPVSWSVARNTVGAFTVPAGLSMAAKTGKGCAGATFTVPLQATGTGDLS
jgi:hypothetical protein